MQGSMWLSWDQTHDPLALQSLLIAAQEQELIHRKATPNKFLDSHPNFVKNWGGREVFIFQTAFNTEQC